MPDRKPARSPRPAASVAADLLDPATRGQLLALVAIFSHSIAKVRLFEDTGSDRTEHFEAPLPATRALRPFAQWLLAIPDSAADETLPGSSPHPPDDARVGVESEHRPDWLVWALNRLLHSPESGTAQSSDEVRDVPAYGYEPASKLDPPWNTIMSLFDDSAAARNTMLDIFVQRPLGTWRIELSPTPELRGQGLAELRRKAPALPDSSGTPSYDLPRDAYLTAPAAAKYLGVDRSTVTRRVGRNELIGFTVFKRALRIPKDQFLGPDVVPGVPDVLALFSRPLTTSGTPVDHKSAWAFLASDLFHGDPQPRPIDRLRDAAAKGTTEVVLANLARAKESLDRGDHL